MEKILRRPALNDSVRDYVKHYIVEHGLTAGDPLPPETQLAQELGVGRSSVREAVKGLQSMGIIEVQHGNGLFVREYNFDPILETLGYGLRLDETMLAQLAQVRFLLERAAIEDAVKCIQDEDLAKLDEIIATWQVRVQENQPYVELDKAFHRILYGTLNNPLLIKLIEVFWVVFESVNNPIIQEEKPLQQEIDDHQAILQAVRARDANLAKERLMAHFAHLQERIQRAMLTLREDKQNPKAKDSK
ncbi:MAG: FadR/GntR family transcriptional regulator [Caldilineaceae bacterium]